MSLLVVRLEPHEAESCSDWLFQLGAEAIEERLDAHEPSLVAGFPNDDLALAARSVLSERWACRLEDTGDETTWRDAWLQYLEPVEVAGFVVHAPWHDPELLPLTTPRISIDPGRAFGSGHHPTTRLALQALRDSLEPDDTVIDAGCGTGILSIAAAKLGARRVTGIDIDHDVLAVATANIEANEVADQVELWADSVIDLGTRYSIVVANIVIGDLKPVLPALVEVTDRLLIVSGFLDRQLDDLLDGLGASLVERRGCDGWACAILAPRG